MAIEMPLPDFKNEQEFRDNWIAPFLAKLGFMNIKNTHGPGEQGKDFFFTDYDRFGHSRFYAAQVKLGNIGSGGKEINDLLDQVKRCFGVKLRFHKGAHEQRVSAVYVMTNGTISEQARVRIHDWCQDERYGENVYFLDGEQLENKDRFATYESDQEKRQHYSALCNELARNGNQLRKQLTSFEKGTGVFCSFRLSALERELLRRPLYEHDVSCEPLEILWHSLNAFNQFDVNTLKVLNKKDPLVDEFRQTIIDRMNDAALIIEQTLIYHVVEINRLNERYSLEVTTVEATA